MNIVWPALLGIFRPAYFAYSVWCWLLPVAALGWGLALCLGYGNQHPWLVQVALSAFALYCALAAYAILMVYWRREPVEPNPEPGAPALANPWQSAFLSWFGSLKWFSNHGGSPGVVLQWPSSYLVENPRGYQINGPALRKILAILQPGDILLRGYRGYIDGEFIRRSSLSVEGGFRPGWFTHVALYVGDLSTEDAQHVNPKFVGREEYFSPGPQRVIHSMAKGVHTEDILTFLRCDYLAVLRLPDVLAPAAQRLIPIAPGTNGPGGAKPSHPLRPSDTLWSTLSMALKRGQSVSRSQVFTAARLAAIEKIGEAYDFDCSDTKAFSRFSCAELLYYCLRGVVALLELQPRPHALYPLAPWFTGWRVLERSTITPDDYYDLVSHGYLSCEWEDDGSREMHKLRKATT